MSLLAFGAPPSIEPGDGYANKVGPRVYGPFTLPDAWREVEGVHDAAIYRPDGSLMLHHAGSLSVRAEMISTARWSNGGPRRAGWKCTGIRCAPCHLHIPQFHENPVRRLP